MKGSDGTNPRTYGHSPFACAVIHGGPGAPGTLAPVARELSPRIGVLEPLQTASSLEGQVEELRLILVRKATGPIALIGHSWGAWLGFITAARYPALVKQLILVGSGPFEERYAASILPTRLARLTEEERQEAHLLLEQLASPSMENDGNAIGRLGSLIAKTDVYDPLILDEEPELSLDGQDDVYRNVWKDASELRRSGKLLSLAREIRCPVVAIHGDYDPHPFEGVQEPLARTVRNFRFHLLEKCGHEPWRERQARDRFYDLLRRELAGSGPP